MSHKVFFHPTHAIHLFGFYSIRVQLKRIDGEMYALCKDYDPNGEECSDHISRSLIKISARGKPYFVHRRVWYYLDDLEKI